jgi:hypothetical protein
MPLRKSFSSSVATGMFGSGCKAFLHHSTNDVRDQDVFSESLLLEEFECSKGGPRVAGRERQREGT